MAGLSKKSLCLVSFLVFNISSQSYAGGVSVTAQGFCVRKSETGCGEVVLPDTTIDLARLPKLQDGTPVLYFYSAQKADAKTVFVHILEAEDDNSRIDYVVSDEVRKKAGDLTATLKTMMKKRAPEGGVVVTPFLNSPSGKSISSIPVSGPGVYFASVVDIKGKIIPASERIFITVIKTPH